MPPTTEVIIVVIALRVPEGSRHGFLKTSLIEGNLKPMIVPEPANTRTILLSGESFSQYTESSSQERKSMQILMNIYLQGV